MIASWLDKIAHGLAGPNPATPNRAVKVGWTARTVVIGAALRARESLLRLGAWLSKPALQRDLDKTRVQRHDDVLRRLEFRNVTSKAAVAGLLETFGIKP